MPPYIVTPSLLITATSVLELLKLAMSTSPNCCIVNAVSVP